MPSSSGAPPHSPSRGPDALRKWWWLVLLVVVSIGVVVSAAFALSDRRSPADLQNEALAPCFSEPWASDPELKYFGDCADNDLYNESLSSTERDFVESARTGPLAGTGAEAVDILGEALVLCDTTRDLGQYAAESENDQLLSTMKYWGIAIDGARTFHALAKQHGCRELLSVGDRSVLNSRQAPRVADGSPPPPPVVGDHSSVEDEQFLVSAGVDGLDTATRERYVVEAGAVCQYRMRGRSNPEMTEYLGNAFGLDSATADQVRVAAITTYCPNYLY